MVNKPKVPALIPGEGCFVAHEQESALGIVVGSSIEQQTPYVEVNWGANGPTKWHPAAELRNGFRAGHIVQDRPVSNTRRTLGTGTVRAIQRVAGRDLVLVQLHDTGETRLLPYENLVRLRDANLKYQRAEAPEPDHGERFRLKALAYSLDSWNQVTGALDRLDVDPLPHQIDLVHRIMTSDQANWLIADDVGLGKTIEVGLLLAAMKRRRQARRVLVVCPAGMVRQWQDEMRYKFNEEFSIYGFDFSINQPSHWSRYDKVIVSIDRAKTDRHSTIFGDSGEWDVIVFDEAHHLSKIEGQAVTQRYQLSEELRKQTDAFIFLTGTPHQGNTLQFINLLVLLRPDLGRRFANVYSDPSVVAEVVLRNQKNLATDTNGNFLFKGQDTHLVEVPLSDPARAFDHKLQEYLRHGYGASEAGGNAGRAIGFVMTTYRKLASSSIAAIERALQRRLARLQGLVGNQAVHYPGGAIFSDMEDAFGEGTDAQDDLEEVADSVIGAATGVNPFFSGEQMQIAGLLTAALEVKKTDRKLDQFLSQIAGPLYTEGSKLLVFTEYRATQEYLVGALQARYSDATVSQINGSMSLNEKRENIDQLNEGSQFMVSTEAGGEGINLHQQCHVMVNYDLPWNPGRLVQRAGRLYRYGQQERVIVFNLMADDGFDNRALSMMLKRVFTIARDMVEVSSEFRDGFQTDIIGELLERVDIASLLAANKTMDINRTESDILEAVDRAREAKTQQEKLFSHVEGYDPHASTALYTFGPEDVLVFLEGILHYKGISIRDRLYNGRVLELELPEDLRGRFSEFPARATLVRITADRQLAMRLANVVSMDFKSVFFSYLIEFAKSPEFKGEYTTLRGPEPGTLGLFKLRWQNDQGGPREEALLPVFLPENCRQPTTNPGFFGSLLLEPPERLVQPDSPDIGVRRNILKLLDTTAHAELAGRCTTLRHPNDVVLLATADLVETG